MTLMKVGRPISSIWLSFLLPESLPVVLPLRMSGELFFKIPTLLEVKLRSYAGEAIA